MSLLLRAEKYESMLESRGVEVERLNVGCGKREIMFMTKGQMRYATVGSRQGGSTVVGSMLSNGRCDWRCRQAGIFSARDAQPHLLASIEVNNISA